MPPPTPAFPVLFSQAQRKAIVLVCPDLAPRLKTEEKNQRVIPLTLRELAVIKALAKTKLKERPKGLNLRHSLRNVMDIAAKAEEKYQGIGLIPVAERVYQFKITLKEYKPAIWRRIQVKDGILDKLHEHIQTAMGWENCHLHDFRINGVRFGDPDLIHDDLEEEHNDYEDSTVIKISEIVPKSGKRLKFEYEYDFGDCWTHEIVFEGCLRTEKGVRYPICVEGERACPPEDVGGTRGFAEYLEAMDDEEHDRHDEFMEWRGKFDPDKFSAEKATKKMRRGLPDWRRMDVV